MFPLIFNKIQIVLPSGARTLLPLATRASSRLRGSHGTVGSMVRL